ncbi:chromatin accessibility complex 16kD protein-like [Drosophila subpulchrella]|uniref:chromatin accessibility complex 16kD protein-like n=1 Tax=Drosophila subpulchrella TaxID=1486046 RepID=UPI0018A12CF1|nr:chromatin accessibility complex 16kD protein-like [Drosophila subpulchrella]
MGEPKIQSPVEHAPNDETVLPLSRVRTIMKSSMDKGLITNEVLFLMTKCTELFVRYLAGKLYVEASRQKSSETLEYEHLSQLVNKSKNLEFLVKIVPEKIRVHKFQEMLLLNRFAGSDDDSESGSESDE